MTTDDFRHMALSLPGAEELNGLGYPNFRIGRKSFATIENSMAVVRFTRDQRPTFAAAWRRLPERKRILLQKNSAPTVARRRVYCELEEDWNLACSASSA